MVHISEIQQLPGFLDTFPYADLLEWKAPLYLIFCKILINLKRPKSLQLRFVVNNPCS